MAALVLPGNTANPFLLASPTAGLVWSVLLLLTSTHIVRQAPV